MEKFKAKSFVSCWGAGGEGSKTQLHIQTSPCSQLCRGKHCSNLGSLCFPGPQGYKEDGLGERLLCFTA